MEADVSLLSGSFGQQHFGACGLGDARLTARVVKTADRFLGHSGGTLPDKLNRNADLLGFYRLANNPKVSHAKLIAAHCARTRQLMDHAAGVVLVIHDTTEIDYSGLDVADLGPIGHGGCRGYLAHNSLAYDYADKEVLGLVNQTLHVRRKVPKGESPKAKREHPDRESRLWKKGWLALGPAAAGRRRVNVADRGADMLEFVEAVHQADDHYLVRSKSNRNIEIDDGRGNVIGTKLHDFARALPSLGERTVAVQANGSQAARRAVVRIACAKVSIKPPHFARGEHSKEDLPTFVVHVREDNPPKGTDPLEWILLTNVPAGDLAAAAERVDWYACRPVVEEYHKAMKTGCGIELPQFTTGPALRATIAVLSVVATQLLRLRDLSRRSDAAAVPATQVIDGEYVEAVSLWRFNQIRADLSVRDFFRALAKLGGHLNRKHDGNPGWLVLWRGWTSLQLLVAGARGARRQTCV
ncbi:MAG TPA: IS4 family transposase [Tepidisphaeraceae bacterium]|jgi:hypothetical protein|nr:IS4 family transposase [Tepidisphaeraceae bacterium]